MAYTRGRCTNFDYCTLADARRDVEVPVGQDFNCPECGKPLKAPPVAKGGGSAVLFAIVGIGALALVGGAVYLGMRLGQTGEIGGKPAPAPVAATPAAATPPAPPPPAPPPAEAKDASPAATPAPPSAAPAPTPAAIQATEPKETVLLRMAGSAEIGEALAPALAAAYLAQIGDTDVKTLPGPKPGQVKVSGQRGDLSEAIIVENSTATDGFKALAGGGTDVVLAARAIDPAEREVLATLGDMTTQAAEHVLALNAAAVVVNPANPVTTIRREQLKGIFSGAIADWRALGGSPGPIDVYAVTPQSEQGVIFASKLLGGTPLAPGAKSAADVRQVAAAVAADKRGIGVVDLPNIGSLHPLTIAETGSAPTAPTNHAAVAAEDYPLAYRLFLYVAPNAQGGFPQKFIEFAQSPDGQKVVQQAGLVSQSEKQAPAAAPQTTLDRLKAFIAGTRKIAVTFHFKPNSTDLDLPSQRDIDRVLNYLLSNHYTADQVLLAGFADNQGDPAANVSVSKKRADAVADQFRAKRFNILPTKVAGFGGELPVADNNTEEGRNKNRRVEVYVPR
jgi:phosphate transport system substrate-binding protein